MVHDIRTVMSALRFILSGNVKPDERTAVMRGSRMLLLVAGHFHCRLKFVSVDDESTVAELGDPPEARSDSHADAHIFDVTVHYLGGESGTLIEFNLRHHVGRLRLEVLRDLSHNRERVNSPEALELVFFKMTFSPALRTDWSGREVVGVACCAAVSNDVVH